MKLKNILAIFTIAFLLLLCISSVSAIDDNDTLTFEDGEAQLEAENDIESVNLDENDEIVANETPDEIQNGTVNNNTPADNTSAENNTPAANTTTQKITKKTLDAFCTNKFIQKSNKYFTVKICKYNEKKNKLESYKNVKITVKVKIGSKTKTFHTKTNSKGEAKIMNIKNLKVGIYSVSVTSNDERYSIKEKGNIAIYSKKTKTLTLKMNKQKKVKGDYIDTAYFKHNSQYKKGVYTFCSNAKKPLDGISHTYITKAKFFFKNKKTGKIITKTIKTKNAKGYEWDYPHTKLISGYTPIKAKIWYAVR